MTATIADPFQPVELRIDVTAAVALPGPSVLAVSVYLPDPVRMPANPLVIFASPGGGYSRGYFAMRFEGHSGYSQAEYHTARGMIFVAYDHLGVGESSTGHVNALRVEMLADANHAMVEAVLARLAQGTLRQGFPPVAKPFVVGIGQSMGAGVTIVMQGRRHTFDAVGILGVSAINTQLPQPTQEAARRSRATFMFTRATPCEELSVPVSAANIMDFRYPFHWEDVPKEILDADMKGGYPVRKSVPPFGSATIPACAVAMNSPGYFTPEAANIDVPVFIGVGERDVCPDPWAEPSAYWNSRDVSLFVVPRMAHMHNFAGTREALWRRLGDWTEMVSRQAVIRAISAAP
ncbi:MAG: alpha/beta hydrolase [Steroidobacteraceae bacterium]